MNDWQTIETAPKDGVVIVTDGGMLWQAFWQNGLGWLTGIDDGVVYVRIKLEPTHWMPLPAGPDGEG